MLTRQVIFDKVKDHLLTQQKHCIDYEGECLYRGDNGLKCAIGALIPDELYRSSFEKRKIATLVADVGALQLFGDNLASDITPTFLGDLQNIHDYKRPQTWKAELAAFAKRNDLTC